VAEYRRTRLQPTHVRTLQRRCLDLVVRWSSPGAALALLLAIGLLVVVGVGWLLGMLLEVIGGGGVTEIDSQVQRFIVNHREPWVTSFMGVATYFGDSSVVLIVVLAVGSVWSWQARAIYPVALLVGAYVGARVTETAVKMLTHRLRPPTEQAIGEFTHFAFPSGHATYAAAIYGTMAALAIACLGSKWRDLVWGAAILIIAVIGFSRVYLGAHWLTDVLGGFLLGAFWAVCLFMTTRTVKSIKASRPPYLNCSDPEQ
jgi:membrane-associated phospholipid phosphatase